MHWDAQQEQVHFLCTRSQHKIEVWLCGFAVACLSIPLHFAARLIWFYFQFAVISNLNSYDLEGVWRLRHVEISLALSYTCTHSSCTNTIMWRFPYDTFFSQPLLLDWSLEIWTILFKDHFQLLKPQNPLTTCNVMWWGVLSFRERKIRQERRDCSPSLLFHICFLCQTEAWFLAKFYHV